ncbi:GNAT family N-acetyltransferase [Desulfospira joergensenii]|uniref:GNAT family N-acetyltransferase n=1 Tax=Desulfospira joergensenii TaxID=53329 RepID=UPI0003B44CBF|nr:GNAT family N-acetyltransferase [Desulfospira joergensenii]
MKDITFKLVTDEDLAYVTDISIKSFHSDIDVGAEVLKGPPGYDSIDFHREMLRESSCFYKILTNQNIIGAFWFMKKGKEEAYVYRLFIEPSFHKHGIGLKIFKFLFQRFPEIKIWQLKTPKWNKRTKQFYEKIGFKISEETERLFFFKM